VKCGQTEEGSRYTRGAKKRKLDESVGDDEKSEPAWVDKVMGGIGGVMKKLAEMEKEEKNWRLEIERRLAEIQKTVDNLPEETDDEDEDGTLKEKSGDADVAEKSGDADENGDEKEVEDKVMEDGGDVVKD
jgi:hypothetical protein